MPRLSARSPSITSQESYSAVMITDLIADVPVSLEVEEPSKATKDATNLAYDSQGELTNPNDTKPNGAGISKGVLLNAVQFGQNDSKTKNDEKSNQKSTSLPVPTVVQQISEPKGFKDMSIPRKIAFGFSFLPSILFVLCFAVILPCNVLKPCIDDIWSTKFNNTEATSGLKIYKDILFTALNQGESFLIKLDKNNGKVNEIKLAANSIHVKCGKIMDKDREDCIVMDEQGKMYSFNDSHSYFLWDPVSEADKQASNPVILSGCQNEMEDVALAVSGTNKSVLMKVLHEGNKKSNFKISDCDSVPERLMPWALNGLSDIVFICEKNGEGRLIRVPKNVWCTFTKNPEEKPILLESGPMVSLKTSVIQPLNDGVLLWTGTEVSLIQPNGTYIWKASNLSHSEKNRFILYGNFYGENHKQIAFFSSSLYSGLTVTLLDPSDGSFIKSFNHSNVEATEVIQVQGKKEDYVILLLNKLKLQDGILTSALSQINDISTTIVSLVSNEEITHAMQYTILEEVAFLDRYGNIDTIKVLKESKDEAYESTMTAVSDKDAGLLSIYVLSTSYNSQMNTTEVRNINIANWDKPAKSKCKRCNC